METVNRVYFDVIGYLIDEVWAECSIKLLRKWILFPFIFLLSLIGMMMVLLFIDGELNDYVLLFCLGSTVIIVVLAKYVWSKWWKAEASVERGWLFLKMWGGANYMEMLPRNIEKVNDLTIKVVGDPWRFYSQGLIIRFNSSDDASRIFMLLQNSIN